MSQVRSSKICPYKVFYFYTTRYLKECSRGIEWQTGSDITNLPKLEEKINIYIDIKRYRYGYNEDAYDLVTFCKTTNDEKSSVSLEISNDYLNIQIVTVEEIMKFCDSLNIKKDVSTINVYCGDTVKNVFLGSVVVLRIPSKVEKIWSIYSQKEDFESIKSDIES